MEEEREWESGLQGAKSASEDGGEGQGLRVKVKVMRIL